VEYCRGVHRADTRRRYKTAVVGSLQQRLGHPLGEPEQE
jgi:hypothetical protein